MWSLQQPYVRNNNMHTPIMFQLVANVIYDNIAAVYMLRPYIIKHYCVYLCLVLGKVMCAFFAEHQRSLAISHLDKSMFQYRTMFTYIIYILVLAIEEFNRKISKRLS